MTSPAPEERGAQGVRGERSVALVNMARSIQSRVSNVLAAGLMIALGVGALAWYYAHALTRPAHAPAQSNTSTRGQGEMTLPSLGRITPPRLAIDAPLPVEMPQEPAASAEAPLSEAHSPSWRYLRLEAHPALQRARRLGQTRHRRACARARPRLDPF